MELTVPPASPAPKPPSPDPVALLAAAGDPVRWKILAALSAGPPMIVVELAAHLDRSADLISKHLRVLRDIGAVTAAHVPGADGRKAHYEIPAGFRAEPGVVDYGCCVLRFPRGRVKGDR